VGGVIIADRYTYLSYVGVGFVIASVYQLLIRGPLSRRAVQRAALMTLLTMFGATLLFATRARCEVWRDNISLWTDVLNRYPTLPRAYTQRARSYMLQGRNDRAMPDLERALSLDPKDGRALTMRGTIRYLKGDNQGALSDLERAVSLPPTDVVAWNSLGAVRFSMGELDQALGDFNRAIELKKDYAEAYLNRALTLRAMHRLDRALEDLDASIKFHSGNAKAYLWRGGVKLVRGDTTGAADDYGRALEIDPKLGEALLARARAFEGLKRYGEALRDVLHAQALGYSVEQGYLDGLRNRAAGGP